MMYYCDCRNSLGKIILSQANLGRGKMQLTNVTNKGTCIYCGYIPLSYKNPYTVRTLDKRLSTPLDKTQLSYIK